MNFTLETGMEKVRGKLESKEIFELFGFEGDAKPHDTVILMNITLL